MRLTSSLKSELPFPEFGEEPFLLVIAGSSRKRHRPVFSIRAGRAVDRAWHRRASAVRSDRARVQPPFFRASTPFEQAASRGAPFWQSRRGSVTPGVARLFAHFRPFGFPDRSDRCFRSQRPATAVPARASR
jgi:hypothetical protein